MQRNNKNVSLIPREQQNWAPERAEKDGEKKRVRKDLNVKSYLKNQRNAPIIHSGVPLDLYVRHHANVKYRASNSTVIRPVTCWFLLFGIVLVFGQFSSWARHLVD